MSTPNPSLLLAPKSDHCCICGSSSLRRFRARAFDAKAWTEISLVECRSCVFAWQYPFVRSEQESAAWFDDAYDGRNGAPSDYFSDEGKREIARLELAFVDSLPGVRGTLLDVGAGSGVFAALAAESGWTVTALDPALDPRRVANGGGITAVRGTIDDLPRDSTFDVVTMWDVIEHATSPRELLEQAAERLQPDGWIVVETGNYKSVARVAGGNDHWIYQLDHRWYFSPDSLRALLEDLGFGELVLADRVLRPGWQGKTRYAGPSRRRLLGSILRDPLRAKARWAEHRELRTASRWPAAGLEIFAIAARRSTRRDQAPSRR